MPVSRDLQPHLRQSGDWYPIVTLTGPRQSGKTTLCRATWPDKPWVSLEPLDRREQATSDPRGFLAALPDGAILDEVQHVPGLLSYLQDAVDRDPRPGQWVLTGSQNLQLLESVSQSLAGRTAILQLLPLSRDEVFRFEDPPHDLWQALWMGSFPRIHDVGIPADRWLADYVTTYVQRDVRQVLDIGDLRAFGQFVRLAAGRSGQELNLSALGADAGVSHNTARSWLSVLETGFLVFTTPAWHPNLRKRLVRAPKLHMVDSGLHCHLLGIRSADELRFHPLRGAVFESWVAAEVMKAARNRGQTPSLFHYRENRGPEVDLVVEEASRVLLVDAKSGQTFAPSFLKHLDRLADRLREAGDPRTIERVLVFGGDQGQLRNGARVVPWAQIGSALATSPSPATPGDR